jgi:uncharacterized protein
MLPGLLDLARPYLENEQYHQLVEYRHHNTTRLNHLYNVAVYSYLIGRKLDRICRVDFDALIAGALLHDFHFVHQHEYKELHCRNTHGLIASRNAIKMFNISDKERNIIEAHMFPMVFVLPKSKEAWIVSFSDKLSAIMESCFNRNYAIPNIDAA